MFAHAGKKQPADRIGERKAEKDKGDDLEPALIGALIGKLGSTTRMTNIRRRGAKAVRHPTNTDPPDTTRTQRLASGRHRTRPMDKAALALEAMTSGRRCADRKIGEVFTSCGPDAGRASDQPAIGRRQAGRVWRLGGDVRFDLGFRWSDQMCEPPDDPG